MPDILVWVIKIASHAHNVARLAGPLCGYIFWASPTLMYIHKYTHIDNTITSLRHTILFRVTGYEPGDLSLLSQDLLIAIVHCNSISSYRKFFQTIDYTLYTSASHCNTISSYRKFFQTIDYTLYTSASHTIGSSCRYFSRLFMLERM